MTNLERRLKYIAEMAEQNEADCQTAQVLALCEIARQVARLVRSHQFVNGIDDDPDDQEESTVVIDQGVVLED